MFQNKIKNINRQILFKNNKYRQRLYRNIKIIILSSKIDKVK